MQDCPGPPNPSVLRGEKTMEYKKDMFDTENIPKFAMQPAKPAEEFDASVYDRLYEAMTELSDETTKQEIKEEPEVESKAVFAEAKTEAEELVEETVEEETVAETEEELLAEIEPEEKSEEELIADAEPQGEPEEELGAVLTAVEQPEAVPVLAKVTKNAPESIKIIPTGEKQINKVLSYTDFCKLTPIDIYIEEDVLVPDVKPDLESILSVEGKCSLAETNVSGGSTGIQSLRLAGDLTVQTLYVPENGSEEQKIISLESKLPFREDCSINGSPNGEITLLTYLDSLEYERINERKFRIKAMVKVYPQEYRKHELSLFNGIEGENIEYLKDEFRFTDVALRRTETIDIKEELKLKEGDPEIYKILSYNVNVVENHKQVNREKAVVNATVYCNILYQSDEKPVFYQGKTEFTQFIKMDDESAFIQPLTGSRVHFQVENLSITPKDNERGESCLFSLDMDVETSVEYFREIEETVVADLYHCNKDIQYDTETVNFRRFCGNGMSEATVREIINIPEKYEGNSQAIYICGFPTGRQETFEQGKCVIEGEVPITLVCLGGEDSSQPFCLQQNLEYRTSMDIPACQPDMEADSEIVLKELWFDQINSRQIEVNASIGVSVNTFAQSPRELIQTVSLLETEQSPDKKPGIVVYVAKEGDNAWKIAKKYRTSMSQIREVNALKDENRIIGGTKLLIVK